MYCHMTSFGGITAITLVLGLSVAFAYKGQSTLASQSTGKLIIFLLSYIDHMLIKGNNPSQSGWSAEVEGGCATFILGDLKDPTR